MATINIITHRYASLSMENPSTATNLHIRKCHFNLDYYTISDAEFNNGKRDGDLMLQIKEINETFFLQDGLFYSHGAFPSTALHLKNHRYISVFDENIHFITVWSEKTNNYCEFLIMDFANRIIDRFVP